MGTWLALEDSVTGGCPIVALRFPPGAPFTYKPGFPLNVGHTSGQRPGHWGDQPCRVSAGTAQGTGPAWPSGPTGAQPLLPKPLVPDLLLNSDFDLRTEARNTHILPNVPRSSWGNIHKNTLKNTGKQNSRLRRNKCKPLKPHASIQMSCFFLTK